MAINKKLIHFLKKENFENEVANGNILDNSIVFIKDTKEIWTHGTYYGSDVEILDNKVDKIEGKGLSTNDFTDSYKSQLDDAPFIKGSGADSAVSNSNYGCAATGANSFANGIYAKATGVASTALGRYCLASGRGAFAGGGLIYTLYLTGSGTKYTLSTSTTANSAPLYWLLHPDKTLIGNEFITAVTNGTNLHVANITEAVVENDIITVTVDKVISTSNISNAKYYLLGCLATGTSSHAEGLSFKASGTSAHVEGSHTIATGFAAHAEGNQTFANENSAHSEGYGTIALGMISHAEGNITQALAEASHAEGNQTKALGPASHTEGLKTSASNIASHAEGNYTIASGQVSHAEGSRTQALGNKSHAEGGGTNAIGHSSHAEGSYTNAVGDMSHVEGGSLFNIYFSGDGSNNTYQIKNGSNWQYAEDLEKLVNAEILETDNFEVVATIKSCVLGDDGYTITVTLDNSLGVLDPYVRYGVRLGIAEGKFSHSQNGATKSVGEASTSMGLFTVAQADSSLSTGCRTIARGENSATFGEHTFTTNNGEFALGISNISHTGETEDSQTLLSVGIGSESPELDMVTRIRNQIPFTSMQDGKNALEIMRNGDIWFGEYNNGIKAYDNATKTTPFIEKSSEDSDKVILGDGTLKSLSEIGGSGGEIPLATSTNPGLMSKEDKIKSDLFTYTKEVNGDSSESLTWNITEDPEDGQINMYKHRIEKDDNYIEAYLDVYNDNGNKRYNNWIEVGDSDNYTAVSSTGVEGFSSDGGFTLDGSGCYASQFVKHDGTSTQILMADGSVKEISEISGGSSGDDGGYSQFIDAMDSNFSFMLTEGFFMNATFSDSPEDGYATLNFYHNEDNAFGYNSTNGTWGGVKAATYIDFPYATQEAAGIMSAADKAKLDSLLPGAAGELPQKYVNALNILEYTTDNDLNEGITITSTSDKTRYIATKSADGNSTLEIGPNYLYGWANNSDESVEIYTLEGWIKASNYIEASKFVIPDGTDTQILMADGSIKEISEISGGGGSNGNSGYSQFIEVLNDSNYCPIIPTEAFFSCATWVDIPEDNVAALDFYNENAKTLSYNGEEWVEGGMAATALNIPYATTTSAGLMSKDVFNNLNDGYVYSTDDIVFTDNTAEVDKADWLYFDIESVYYDEELGRPIYTPGLTLNTFNPITGEIGRYNAVVSPLGIPSATTTKAGLMSAADKSKLDGLSANGGSGEDSRYSQLLDLLSFSNYNIPDEGAVAGEYVWDDGSNNEEGIARLAFTPDGESKMLTYSDEFGWTEQSSAWSIPNIPVATTTSGGVMSPEDKAKLDSITVDSSGNTFELPVASSNNLGGVMIGDGLSITEGGVLSSNYSQFTKTLDEGEHYGAILTEQSFSGYWTASDPDVSYGSLQLNSPHYYYDGEKWVYDSTGFVTSIDIPYATTTEGGIMSKEDKTNLDDLVESVTSLQTGAGSVQDSVVSDLNGLTISGNSVELSYRLNQRSSNGSYVLLEDEAVSIPLSTSTTAGLMSKEDKVYVDNLNKVLSVNSDNTGVIAPKFIKSGASAGQILMADGSVKNGYMTIKGTFNLAAASGTAFSDVFNDMIDGEMRMYLITDSNGSLPSLTETAVTVTYGLSYFGKSESFGASVGDILVFLRKSTLFRVCRIIPLNDVKPSNGDFPGADGLSTVWDKNRINKIDGIEWTANHVRDNYLPKSDRFPSRPDWLIHADICFDAGVYPTCDTVTLNLGWTNQYGTLVVHRTSTVDNGGYHTIEQTVYGRGTDEGQMYKRIIFCKSDGSDTQYGDWLPVVSKTINVQVKVSSSFTFSSVFQQMIEYLINTTNSEKGELTLAHINSGTILGNFTFNHINNTTYTLKGFIDPCFSDNVDNNCTGIMEYGEIFLRLSLNSSGIVYGKGSSLANGDTWTWEKSEA